MSQYTDRVASDVRIGEQPGGRVIRSACIGLVLAVMALGTPTLVRAQSGQPLLLYPDTTRGIVFIPDAQNLVDHWNETQLGRLSRDPVMKPFMDDLKRQFEDQWTGLQSEMGLTIEDLRNIASGAICLGLVEPSPGVPAVTLTVEVAENTDRARGLMDKIAAAITERGGTRSTLTIAGLPVFVFRMPVPADSPLADQGPREVYYLLTEELLAVSTQEEAITIVAERLAGKVGPAVAHVEAFQVIVERCLADAGSDFVTQFLWFIAPFEYGEAIHAALPEAERKQVQRRIDQLEKAGFNSLRGVGGFVDFSTDDFEMVTRTFVFAPKPWADSMKMFSFPNGTEFAPPAWVPRDIATYCTAYFDPLAVFDNLGPLINQIYGAGEPLWEGMIEGIKTDEGGPQFDIRNEFVATLGDRLHLVVHYKEPVSPSGERILVALEVTDEAAAQKAVQEIFRNDEMVERATFKDYIIWRTVPPEDEAEPEATINLSPLAEARPAEAAQEEPLFPNGGVCVAKGYLFIASHVETLTAALDAGETTLTDTPDFELIRQTFDDLGAGKNSMRRFVRTARSVHHTYELIRQNRMPESQSLFGGLLNLLIPPQIENGERKPLVDGSELPEFEAVRRSFGPAGSYGVTEDDGWFIKGFLRDE